MRLAYMWIAALSVGIGAVLFSVNSRAQPPTGQPTRTIDNLNTAIGGEANAARRYLEFAKRADAEGYAQVAKLFRAISRSESIHRSNHERVLKEIGGKVEPVIYKPVEIGSTKENLKGPIQGEKKEESEMYPLFIEQAQRDHLPAAVQTFTYAMDAERQHEALLKDALAHLGKNKQVDYYVDAKTGATYARPLVGRMPA